MRKVLAFAAALVLLLWQGSIYLFAGVIAPYMTPALMVIPEDVLFTPGRLTLMATGHVTCDEEVYDVSFKVWSTINRAIGLFFLADDADTWELLTCNLGDVIEGRFQAPGTYAIAVGW